MGWTVRGLLAVILAALGGAAALPVHAQEQALRELVASYAGQHRILRAYGDEWSVTVRYDWVRAGGECDAGVLVKEAELDGRRARFKLKRLGKINVGNIVRRCRNLPDEISFSISRIPRDETPQALRAAVDDLLMKPETYLARNGVGFEWVEKDDGSRVARMRPVARGVRTGGDCWLTVSPKRIRAARRLEDENAAVLVRATLGADGAFHNPQVTESLGRELDELALQVIPLWRCEPVVENGRKVEISLQIPVRFRREK